MGAPGRLFRPLIFSRCPSWPNSTNRRDRGKAIQESEAVFERAIEQYGDVKVPYGETVAAKAKSEIYEIRHLSVGREVLDIEGPDQEGQPFKLSDYRGKIVLLYFWSQY